MSSAQTRTNFLQIMILLQLPLRVIEFPRRPLIMGIVNINDDSFSGDGTLDPIRAAQLAADQIAHGADVIDVGAESARTNRSAIPVEQEIRRFNQFLAQWDRIVTEAEPRDNEQVWPPILSANTWRPEVVAAVLESGKVELVNDMGALPDARNAELAANSGAGLLLMHSIGEPKVPQTHQYWDDVMGELEQFFVQKSSLAHQAGLNPHSLVLDPGIDFAKQKIDNLLIYKNLERLSVFTRPVLVPVSRKTVIGDVLGLPLPSDRDAGTMACIAVCMSKLPALIFRVHHVDATWQVVKSLHHLSQLSGNRIDARFRLPLH